jgi:hypothetical protein
MAEGPATQVVPIPQARHRLARVGGVCGNGVFTLLVQIRLRLMSDSKPPWKPWPHRSKRTARYP